jgi:hypothetical protein
MKKKENHKRVLVGKTERKRYLGRPRRRWENLIIRILKKQYGWFWTAFMLFRMGTSSGFK